MGEGPFREMVSVRIVVEPRDRQGLFVGTVRFVALVGALGNLMAAVFSSQSWFIRALWAGQAVFLALVFAALRREAGPLLVVNAHDIELSSGKRLALADIERTIVRDVHGLGPESGVHELVVKTHDREVVVASEQTERDARYLATLIDAARGARPGS